MVHSRVVCSVFEWVQWTEVWLVDLLEAARVALSESTGEARLVELLVELLEGMLAAWRVSKSDWYLAKLTVAQLVYTSVESWAAKMGLWKEYVMDCIAVKLSADRKVFH